MFFIFGFGVVCLLLYTSCQPEPELSSEKEITAFSFTPAANPELDITATGTLTGTDISVILPYGTDPGSLTADFTATGAGVSVNENLQFSGTTANDFTAPVTYTVIAEDGTTRDYTVTVLLRAVEDSGFHEASAPGDAGILRLGETLTMIYAQDRATITFPTETDDSGSAELTTRFWMGETEVTNAAMAEVLQWAYDNGKFSSTAGDHNGLDITAAKFGGRVLLALEYDNCKVKFDGFGTFYAVNGFEDHPVTEVSWYGAVMFCNWLTEMRDGNTDNVVYTNIGTTW